MGAGTRLVVLLATLLLATTTLRVSAQSASPPSEVQNATDSASPTAAITAKARGVFALGTDAVSFIASSGGLAYADSIAKKYGVESGQKILDLLASDKDFGIIKGTGRPFYACTRKPRQATASSNSSNNSRRLLRDDGQHHHHHHPAQDHQNQNDEALQRSGRKLHQTLLPLANLADPAPASVPVTATGVPRLSSRPSATRKIYLDFDGHTYTGTEWSDVDNNPVSPVVTPRYDSDGNRNTFSDAEKREIIAIWRSVAEDYAAFDVDVTTQDPGDAGLYRSSATDTSYGIRVCIGGNVTDWFGTAGSAVGVALFNSFGGGPIPVPVYVFSGDYYGPGQRANAMGIWETVSHEVGHTFGLDHDGVTGGAEYYQGQGVWAPIMGFSDDHQIATWSIGDYASASNKQDDFAVMSTLPQNMPYVPDDHSNSATGATALSSGVAVPGIMGGPQDTADYFYINATAGAMSARVDVIAPWASGLSAYPNGYGRSNLDVVLTLRNSAGTTITSANPVVNPSAFSISQQGASISVNLPAAGVYTLAVTKTGAGDPLTTGYSSYGSVGYYAISATFTPRGGSAPSTPSPSPARSPSPSPARSPSPSPAPTPPRPPVTTITQTISCAGSSNSGMQLLGTRAYVNDGSRAIAVPFSFRFQGVDYGNTANGGIHVGSNSYITFGRGATDFQGLGPSVPSIGTVFIGATNAAFMAVYAQNVTNVNGANWYKVRYEGWAAATTAATAPVDVIWEAWFSSRNELVICTGANAGVLAGSTVTGVSSGAGRWLAGPVSYAKNAQLTVFGLA